MINNYDTNFMCMYVCICVARTYGIFLADICIKRTEKATYVGM